MNEICRRRDCRLTLFFVCFSNAWVHSGIHVWESKRMWGMSVLFPCRLWKWTNSQRLDRCSMHGSTKLSSSMLDRCSHLEPPGPESACCRCDVCMQFHCWKISLLCSWQLAGHAEWCLHDLRCSWNSWWTNHQHFSMAKDGWSENGTNFQ